MLQFLNGQLSLRKKPLSLPVVWREARDLVWTHRRRLSLGLALLLVNRLSGLVLPATSKYLIDDVIGKHQGDLLVWLAAAAGAATVVQAATSFALSQVLGVAAQRAITDMRRDVQAHVLRLPISYFDSTKTGVLISRIMTDAEGIRNLVGTGLVQLVGGLVTAGIALGLLFYLNWRLTTLTLVVLLTFGGGMAVAFKRLRPLFRERGKINAEVTGRLGESLGGIRIVKSYIAEKREEIVFTRGAHRLFRNVARSITGVSAITAFSTVIVGVIGVLMIVVGGRSILAGAMTLGDFIMYLFFTGLVAAPLVQIASIGTQVSEAFAGLDRIREIRSMATEGQEDETKRRVESLRGDVRFEHVSFEYTAGVPVLRDVSFDSPAGSTTALVGSSGSGKSTLISLVMAFNQPRSGTVLVDGVPLSDVRLHDYRAHLGVVLQDNFLFDGTIAENIAFARPRASRDEIVAVSRIAHCEEFIREFPDQYETIVGERGVRLSGGPAPADRDRPRDPGRPAHPDSRRGDVEPRQRERGADPGRPAVAPARPHDVRHRAPAVHHSERRPDPRARGRADRRAGHATGNCWPPTAATGSSTTSSTGWSRTGSSTPARRFLAEPD